MAKISIIERQKKREKLVTSKAARRAELKAIIKDLTKSPEERWQAQIALQKMPRNACAVRLVNRCQLTGRSHGVYRRFGLGRNKLRELSMRGDVPGVVKASW